MIREGDGVLNNNDVTRKGRKEGGKETERQRHRHRANIAKFSIKQSPI